MRRLRALLSSGTVGALVVSTMMVPGIAQTTVPAADENALAGSSRDPKPGDLSHLVYTARTGLFARAVAPDDGGVVNTLATSFEVVTIAGAGVEVAVNGTVVPVKQLGRRAELEDKTVHYTFYGVRLGPGSNTVVLTPLGAGGLRGPSVTEHVWGPGKPAKINLFGCAKPYADGRTPCAMRVAAVDAWGHPAAPGTTLKIAIGAGDALIQTTGIGGGELALDGNGAPSGATGRRTIAVVLAPGSTVTFAVVPGSIPGRIGIAAGIGDVSSSLDLDAMAVPRHPIVTGLATVGIGAVPGEVGADPTAADGTNSRRGRIALFGTGSLFGNAVGSLAYDTAGALAATPSSGTFNDDPNDRPYATYGDSSMRRNDALTQDRLYARVDDGYSNAMWGEFQASTGPPGAAGSVAMQVDGAKVTVGSATTSLTGFTAANQVGYGRQVLLPSGLAVLNTLDHDNLVIGSESVTLVSLDRRTGAIVNQTPLQNVVDYTIDYTSGIIRFINIPLPYDASFNPQQVLVTYEYSALGGDAKTVGARFDAPLGRFDGIKFGLGYLNDISGINNFSLLSENATGRLPGGSWSFSHAGSVGEVPGTTGDGVLGGETGSALRFSGTTTDGPLKLSFGYDTTTPSYGNPFGDLATPGLTDYHAALIRTLGHSGDFSFSFDRAHNAALAAGGSMTESNLSAILHEKFGSRVSVRAGFTMHESDTIAALNSALGTTLGAGPQSSPTPAPTTGAQIASVAQANLGVDWKATRNLAFSVERDQTVGGNDPTQPAQTLAQASWDLNGHGRIFAKELLSDTPAETFGSFGAGSSSHAFEFGVEEKVDANTSVDSDYSVAGTGNSTDINAAIGVKEHFVISKLLKGDTFVQRGVGGGSATGAFNVYGMSLGYSAADGGIKATGSLQDRTGSGGGATWSLGAAGRLGNDFSLLAADTGSRTLDQATSDARIALAWRPSTSDRGALFAGFERSAGNADVSGAQSGVVSLDGQYRLTHRLQLTGRFAEKTDGDSNYVAGTQLIGFGVRQQLGPRYDVGIETRDIRSRSTTSDGIRSTATEFGAMLGNTLRAALGYNFGSTADPTLAAGPARKGIYATLTTTIDRIFGWGAH